MYYSGFWWSHQLTSALGLYPQFQAEYRSFFLPVTITKGHLWVLEISLCQSTKCGKDNPPAGCKKNSHAQHFGGISQRHVAGCLMLLDVTIPIISLIISHTHSNLTSLYQPFHFYGSTFRDQPPWRLSPPQYLSSRWSVPKPSAGDLSGGGVYSPNRPKK